MLEMPVGGKWCVEQYVCIFILFEQQFYKYLYIYVVPFRLFGLYLSISASNLL